MLADRLLGRRKAVVVGGTLMAVGHFLMASESLLFVALLLLIMGNGCFKPNIATQVGGLYGPADPRRDRAYLVFLGAFIAPLLCGTLGQTLGWHYGFGAAGVGMVLGLVFYLFNRPITLAVVVVAFGIGWVARLPADERPRMMALCTACLLTAAFWAVYEQQGNTLQIWADESTRWPTVFGFTIPSTWYQSFNPFMIWSWPTWSATT